jgi:predicted alpha/beta-hydrolase family hydrolase
MRPPIDLPPAAGLVFFGYPLHPPDAPAKRRDAHLSDVKAPMLFIHGTRDPFGSPDEMRALTAALPSSLLHLVEGGDHSLQRSRRWETVDEAMDAAATWILDKSEVRS